MRRQGITFTGMTMAFLFSIASLVPAGLWCAGVERPWVTQPPKPQPPAIAMITVLSELATTKVHISTQLIGDNRAYHAEYKVDGDVILGIDLSKVAYVHVNGDKREVVLRLPNPHLIMARVDHLASRELSITPKGWITLSSKQAFHDEAWWQADRKINRLAREEPGYAERAKVQAERVLETLFKGLGWAVSFEYEQAAKAADATPKIADTEEQNPSPLPSS
jgi:Protein of unknown function (DUF4230)